MQTTKHETRKMKQTIIFQENAVTMRKHYRKAHLDNTASEKYQIISIFVKYRVSQK